MGEILKANRPLEYVAFCHVKMNIVEGFAYMFLAVDAYSKFAINLGVEHDDSPQTILKNIYELTENEEFTSLNNQGFTLVMEENEDLAERIEAIIKSVNGKLIYNKTYNNRISNPVLLSILNKLNKDDF